MDTRYRPDLDTFCDILRDYARHGLKHFKAQPDSVQRAIRAALENHIEDDEREIDVKFGAVKREGPARELKFLPMPKPGGHDFRVSFFLPRFKRSDGGGYTCSFVVLWWIERDKGRTLALRVEPSEAGTAHAYTHWQFTREIGAITTSSEPWLPTSYPAIPLGYDHPVQLFMGLAAAVHGYGGSESAEFVRHRIREAMAQGSPGRAEKLLGELGRMLSAPAAA
jgi:hypothetical protein